MGIYDRNYKTHTYINVNMCISDYISISSFRLYQHCIHHLTPHQSTQTTFANLCECKFSLHPRCSWPIATESAIHGLLPPDRSPSRSPFPRRRWPPRSSLRPTPKGVGICRFFVFFDRPKQQRHQLKTVEIMMEIIQMHMCGLWTFQKKYCI